VCVGGSETAGVNEKYAPRANVALLGGPLSVTRLAPQEGMHVPYHHYSSFGSSWPVGFPSARSRRPLWGSLTL